MSHCLSGGFLSCHVGCKDWVVKVTGSSCQRRRSRFDSLHAAFISLVQPGDWKGWNDFDGMFAEVLSRVEDRDVRRWSIWDGVLGGWVMIGLNGGGHEVAVAGGLSIDI